MQALKGAGGGRHSAKWSAGSLGEGKDRQSPSSWNCHQPDSKSRENQAVGSVKFCFFHLKVTGVGFFFLLLFEKVSCSLSKKIKQHISAKRTVFVLWQAHLPLQLLEGHPYREERGKAGNNFHHPPLSAKFAAELRSKQQF